MCSPELWSAVRRRTRKQKTPQLSSLTLTTFGAGTSQEYERHGWGSSNEVPISSASPRYAHSRPRRSSYGLSRIGHHRRRRACCSSSLGLDPRGSLEPKLRRQRWTKEFLGCEIIFA